MLFTQKFLPKSKVGSFFDFFAFCSLSLTAVISPSALTTPAVLPFFAFYCILFRFVPFCSVLICYLSFLPFCAHNILSTFISFAVFSIFLPFSLCFHPNYPQSKEPFFSSFGKYFSNFRKFGTSLIIFSCLTTLFFVICPKITFF